MHGGDARQRREPLALVLSATVTASALNVSENACRSAGCRPASRAAVRTCVLAHARVSAWACACARVRAQRGPARPAPRSGRRRGPSRPPARPRPPERRAPRQLPSRRQYPSSTMPPVLVRTAGEATGACARLSWPLPAVGRKWPSRPIRFRVHARRGRGGDEEEHLYRDPDPARRRDRGELAAVSDTDEASLVALADLEREGPRQPRSPAAVRPRAAGRRRRGARRPRPRSWPAPGLPRASSWRSSAPGRARAARPTCSRSSPARRRATAGSTSSSATRATSCCVFDTPPHDAARGERGLERAALRRGVRCRSCSTARRLTEPPGSPRPRIEGYGGVPRMPLVSRRADEARDLRPAARADAALAPARA